MSEPTTNHAPPAGKWRFRRRDSRQAMIPRIRSLTSIFFIAMVALWAARPIHGQNRLIIQEEISVSKQLAGHVYVHMTGAPVAGATADLYSSDWKTVLASTTTDGTGHFSFEKPPSGKLFYIQISAQGMNAYRLRVRVARHASHILTIQLSVAT